MQEVVNGSVWSVLWSHYGRAEIKRLFWVVNKTATGTMPTGLHNHVYAFTFAYYHCEHC